MSAIITPYNVGVVSHIITNVSELERFIPITIFFLCMTSILITALVLLVIFKFQTVRGIRTIGKEGEGNITNDLILDHIKTKYNMIRAVEFSNSIRYEIN